MIRRLVRDGLGRNRKRGNERCIGRCLFQRGPRQTYQDLVGLDTDGERLQMLLKPCHPSTPEVNHSQGSHRRHGFSQGTGTRFFLQFFFIFPTSLFLTTSYLISHLLSLSSHFTTSLHQHNWSSYQCTIDRRILIFSEGECHIRRGHRAWVRDGDCSCDCECVDAHGCE